MLFTKGDRVEDSCKEMCRKDRFILFKLHFIDINKKSQCISVIIPFMRL